MIRPGLALALLSAPVAALTPPLPCTGVIESGLWVSDPVPLGGYDYLPGVVVETYALSMELVGDTYVHVAPPVPQLAEFHGARAVHCASGTFFALPRTNANDAALSLAATEFLRPQVRGGELVTAEALRRAVAALYPDAVELRETAQTCGCDWYFPDLRPAGQTPFAARTDVTYE